MIKSSFEASPNTDALWIHFQKHKFWGHFPDITTPLDTCTHNIASCYYIHVLSVQLHAIYTHIYLELYIYLHILHIIFIINF